MQIYSDMESKPAYRNPGGLIRTIDHPCLWFYPDRIREICGKNQGLGFGCGSAALGSSVQSVVIPEALPLARSTSSSVRQAQDDPERSRMDQGPESLDRLGILSLSKGPAEGLTLAATGLVKSTLALYCGQTSGISKPAGPLLQNGGAILFGSLEDEVRQAARGHALPLSLCF